MKFHLLTTISWETSYNEPNSTKTLSDEFQAKDVKAAVLRAKKLVRNHHETNRDKWDHSYSIKSELVQLVWNTEFFPAKKGQPAVSARAAHFQETLVSVAS